MVTIKLKGGKHKLRVYSEKPARQGEKNYRLNSLESFADALLAETVGIIGDWSFCITISEYTCDGTSENPPMRTKLEIFSLDKKGRQAIGCSRAPFQCKCQSMSMQQYYVMRHYKTDEVARTNSMVGSSHLGKIEVEIDLHHDVECPDDVSKIASPILLLVIDNYYPQIGHWSRVLDDGYRIVDYIASPSPSMFPKNIFLPCY